MAALVEGHLSYTGVVVALSHLWMQLIRLDQRCHPAYGPSLGGLRA